MPATSLQSADQPQWGHAWSRNQVSAETGLPAMFDPATGKNINWRARLGTEAHATPVVANGRVYIGTNNNEPRDPRHVGDRGVLMCFDEQTGKLLWQLVVPKRHEDPYFDWPNSGISSPVTVEGDRVYLTSNRGEVICLDAKGLADGNDGPFQDEGAHMTPGPGADRPPKANAGAEIRPLRTHSVTSVQRLKAISEPMTPGPLDADIVWIFDMVEGAGIWPHDGAHSSVLIRGDHLYLNTATGVDNTHRRIRTPDAPSLIVLDKRTGRLLGREREGIAPFIFHNTWSAPSMAKVDGRELIFYCGGNGIVYAFEPLKKSPPPGEVATLKKVWQFDIDPTAPKTDVHRYNQNRREGPSNIFGLPVIHDGRLYVAGGGDIWWGKNESWLFCIDPRGEGDITGTNLIWRAPLGYHVMSTPAVVGDLVFIADTSRFIYCLDAKSGEVHWKHEAKGDFWASPYVADGKMYIGSRRGDFWVFEASREKKLLAELDLGAPISATAVAANGTLYVATMFDLFAIRRP
ncbi:MAG TPA: pyrrolo-quinoline quinone [Verrucomicrobiales bacterium]|nr:pyrrolo-quinoline quinone [Verrucomicrobiales bacterium]